MKTVSGDEVIQNTVKAADAQEVTGLQRVGKDLAMRILVLIGLVILGLGLFLYARAPEMPPITEVQSPGTTEALIQHYQSVSNVAIQGAQDMFHTVVTNVLFPLLTAVLGYMFGRESADAQLINGG
jgi:hypothetical protein